VVVPCYNEERTIRLLLDAINRQTYPRANMEVILADGLSTDGTRQQVTLFQDEHPELAVRLVDNPKRVIPAGLNVALAAAAGEYIIRLDAHSMPAPEYVERCVSALRAGSGDNVGGVWEIRPGKTGWLAESIAVAAAHPLGVGDALYRFTTRAGLVDTVPFGAFRRVTFEKIGKFDENLLTNEDYEFNARLRQAGGRVWLDPAIRSVYFARPGLGSLARQYFRYGYWKRQMLRRYAHTLRWRQALPPVFVLSLIGLLLLAPWWNMAGWLLLAEVLVYLFALLVGSAPAVLRAKKGPRLLLGVPAAIATMHLSWGTGFLWSLLNPRPKQDGLRNE
jgi:glycosyltransferase involved in cell wall biosynthesis